MKRNRYTDSEDILEALLFAVAVIIAGTVNILLGLGTIIFFQYIFFNRILKELEAGKK